MPQYLEEEKLEFRSTGGGSVPKGRAVFLCYAREDRKWVDRLKIAFKLYVRQARLTIWDDQEIKFGQNWNSRIQDEISTAKAVVLFISMHFLASDYIVESEVPAFLSKRKEDDSFCLFPILVSPSPWKDAEFKYPDALTGPHTLMLRDLQAVNRNALTLSEMTEPEQDHFLTLVASELNRALGNV